MTQDSIAVLELVVVGAITPGPNNFAVMHAASIHGTRGAVSSIAGVVLGAMVLLVVVLIGAGELFQVEPWLKQLCTIAGSGYLIWLGLGIAIAGIRNGIQHGPASRKTLPSGLVGLGIFQLMNPKAWALMTTVVSASQAKMHFVEAMPFLVAVFTIVPTICLALWAVLGVAISRYLEQPGIRTWFDLVMGSLLAGTAGFLIVDTWNT